MSTVSWYFSFGFMGVYIISMGVCIAYMGVYTACMDLCIACMDVYTFGCVYCYVQVCVLYNIWTHVSACALWVAMWYVFPAVDFSLKCLKATNLGQFFYLIDEGT